MQNKEEVFYINHKMDNKLSDEITKDHIEDAAKRLLRFSPYIKEAFKETTHTNGIIESPLKEIPNMKKRIEEYTSSNLNGRFLLKCDDSLPISGSIKARGGIYEVLFIAEKIAMENGMLKFEDDYSILNEEKFKKLFSNYSIGVASTGNLGLSIGIMSAKLGFNVTVHMSNDAKKWKKDLLREKGANVIEYDGDFQVAIENGRKHCLNTVNSHFIDDEDSLTLFLGYAVAAERLKLQLENMNIFINDENPLMVYLPCGVGGGPGGITYGLKQIFKENAHCFFAEPVEAPSMLLGILTGLYDKISVYDIGLSCRTLADGLAVGRCSKLVSKFCGNLIDGAFTLQDKRLFDYMKMLYESEGIFIEPSATAGFHGAYYLNKNLKDVKNIENAIHVFWSTGGQMVPLEERQKYLNNY